MRKKGLFQSGSTKLTNKAGPLASGTMIWGLPPSGSTRATAKTGLLLPGSVNSTKERGLLVSDMKEKKGLWRTVTGGIGGGGTFG